MAAPLEVVFLPSRKELHEWLELGFLPRNGFPQVQVRKVLFLIIDLEPCKRVFSLRRSRQEHYEERDDETCCSARHADLPCSTLSMRKRIKVCPRRSTADTGVTLRTRFSTSRRQASGLNFCFPGKMTDTLATEVSCSVPCTIKPGIYRRRVLTGVRVRHLPASVGSPSQGSHERPRIQSVGQPGPALATAIAAPAPCVGFSPAIVRRMTTHLPGWRFVCLITSHLATKSMPEGRTYRRKGSSHLRRSRAWRNRHPPLAPATYPDARSGSRRCWQIDVEAAEIFRRHTVPVDVYVVTDLIVPRASTCTLVNVEV